MDQSHRFFIYVLIVLLNLSFLPASMIAQGPTRVRRQVQLFKDGKVNVLIAISPRSIEPEINRFFVSNARPVIGLMDPGKPGTIYGGASLVRVTPYFRVTPTRYPDGSISSQTVSHPESYPALITNDQLYVFTEQDIYIDTEIFNEYLANLSSMPKNLGVEPLANLYLQATRGYSERKGKIVLKGVKDIPKVYLSRNEAEVKLLDSIVVAPIKTDLGDRQRLVVYTWEAMPSEVRRWIFESAAATIAVESVVVGKL